MKKVPQFKSILELVQVFSSEKVCLDYLKKLRWSEGAYCPYCGCKKLYAFKDGVNYKCADCRKRFSAKVGSIFEDSKVPLQKWFIAIYLLSAHKKGISSLQLSRDLNVTQKTAWFILHRLRHASQTGAFNAPLKNVVEADETYVGGKEKNKHVSKRQGGLQGRSTAVKTPVLAVVERKGNIKAVKSDAVDSRSVSNFIAENVVFGTKVMTDEYRVYNAIKWLYEHNVVRHGQGQYVHRDCHTNTVEGFFSLLKRGIVGIYHFVSPKHLDKYLHEFTFRYNSKNYTEQSRFDLMIEGCDRKRLKYKELIA